MKKLVAIATVLLFSGAALARSGSAGVRVDLSPWGKFSRKNGGTLKFDQKFSFGAGAFGEYRVWDYLAVGGSVMSWFVKPEGGKYEKLIGFLPYLKGFYDVNDMITPYGFVEFGFGVYLPDVGDSRLMVPVGGGAGCEFNFGDFGAFLDVDVLYHLGVKKVNGTKLNLLSLGINIGGKYNF